MAVTSTNSFLLTADDGKWLFLFETFIHVHLVDLDVNSFGGCCVDGAVALVQRL